MSIDPTEENSLQADHGPYRPLSKADLENSAWLFLGEAIDWIICRGQTISDDVFNEEWDKAERALFDALDEGQEVPEGYRTDLETRVYEPLPKGIWARMNRGSARDPQFSPVDDVEERDDGGWVRVGYIDWYGVRVRSSFVLQRWPAAERGPLATVTAPRDVATKRGRKPKYNRRTFQIEVRRMLEHEGVPNGGDPHWTKAHLVHKMALWCVEQWNQEPSPAWLHSRIDEATRAFEEDRAAH